MLEHDYMALSLVSWGMLPFFPCRRPFKITKKGVPSTKDSTWQWFLFGSYHFPVSMFPRGPLGSKALLRKEVTPIPAA